MSVDRCRHLIRRCLVAESSSVTALSVLRTFGVMMSVWGYLMLAAEDIGIDKGTLSELVRAMKSAFDDVSVSDAERKYKV